MQVTLIDPSPNPGGVCLYRGCIPSKALLHVAEVLNEAKHADAWGVTFGAPQIDLDRLRAFKTKVVTQLTGGLGQLSKQRKITYVQGTATFKDSRTLEIAREDGASDTADVRERDHRDRLTSRAGPGLSIDSPRLMDSTAALDLPDIPKSLLVVGGGYIGLELGTVYAALGTNVTVVEMTAGLLAGRGPRSRERAAKRIEAICEAVLLNTKVVVDEGARRTASPSRSKEPSERKSRLRPRARLDRPRAEPGARASRRPRSRSMQRASSKSTAPVGPRSRHLRDRRRRRRADAGAQGVARRTRRRRSDRRPEGRLRAAGDSGGRLHRSRSWRGAASPRAMRRSRTGRSPSRGSRGARRAAR